MIATLERVDVEELWQQQIPCAGINRANCPNEVAWRVTVNCCGTFFICAPCYAVLTNGLAHGDQLYCLCGNATTVTNLVRS